MQRFPMTLKGVKALQNELYHLKQEDRPRIIQAISEARALGDLSENAEYHSAREQQNRIEARIAALEKKLSRAEVIDISKIPNEGKVIFGATVHLIGSTNRKKTIVYQIVGDDEASVEENKISIHSPLARALIGKKEGEKITVDTPNGKMIYEITQVEYRVD